MKANTNRTTTTRTVDTYEFTAEELIEALKQAGLLPNEISHKESTVFVRVPGGGDWSNTDLEIDEDRPLTDKVDRTITQ